MLLKRIFRTLADVDRMYLARGKDQLRTFVNRVRYHRIL